MMPFLSRFLWGLLFLLLIVAVTLCPYLLKLIEPEPETPASFDLSEHE